MAPPQAKRSLFLPLLLAAYAAWALLYLYRASFVLEGTGGLDGVAEGTRVFTLWDDAMISMRYAANLWAGHGLQWNIEGPPVQGISNLALCFVMAPLHGLPLDRFTISLPFLMLELAVLLACIALGARTAARIAGDERAGHAAALAIAACGPAAIWGLQGADTAFVSLWLLVALHALAPRSDGSLHWPAWLFAFLGVGLWIRMDFALFCAAFGIASLWVPARGEADGAGPLASARLRRAALGALQGGAFFAALLGFQYAVYGDPLPNTYYLKATGQPRGLMALQALVQMMVWWPLLPVLALAIWAGVRHARVLAVRTGLAATALALLYNVWVGGDWAVPWGSRFLVPLFPVLLLLASLGARALLASIPMRVPGAAALALAGLLPSLVLNSSTTLREWWDPRAPTMYREENAQLLRTALWLEANTLPSTTIAVHYGGIPPYFSRRHAIDVLGKSDPHIAHMKVDFFQSGHSKWDWEYVLREHAPDLFLTASRGLAQRNDFRFDYYRATTGDGLELYVRKSARYKITDPTLVLVDQVTGIPAG